MKTFNLFNGETDEVPPGAPGHPGRAARVGSKLGAERLGMSVYEIPPGEAIGPYHFEWTDEEWLTVLDGLPTVRTPEGETVMLVQTHRARARCQVVVSRSLLRSPPQESRP